MSFEEITEQEQEIWPRRLDLGDPSLQPLFTEKRAEVLVGHGDEYHAIHLVGKTANANVVFFHYRRS